MVAHPSVTSWSSFSYLAPTPPFHVQKLTLVREGYAGEAAWVGPGARRDATLHGREVKGSGKGTACVVVNCEATSFDRNNSLSFAWAARVTERLWRCNAVSAGWYAYSARKANLDALAPLHRIRSPAMSSVTTFAFITRHPYVHGPVIDWL